MDKKERHRLASKKYREANKQKCYEASKKSQAKNPEKYKEIFRRFAKTDHRKKYNRIRDWISQGIIDDDFESLHQAWIETTECMICGHDFSKHKKCLDHDHDIIEEPNVRYICCHICNVSVVK